MKRLMPLVQRHAILAHKCILLTKKHGVFAYQEWLRFWRKPRTDAESIILLLSAMLLTILLWASLAKVHETVHGAGKTIPAGQNKVIQHLEGGLVEDILVTEGSVVQAGDVLFRIRNQAAASALMENEGNVAGLRLKILRLTAEAENLETFIIPDDVRLATGDLARTEEQAFQTKRDLMMQTINTLEERYRQKQVSIETNKARLLGLTGQLAIANEQLKNMQELFAAGATSRNRLLDARNRASQLSVDKDNAAGAIQIAEAEAKEVESQKAEAWSRYQKEAREELVTTQINLAQLEQRQKLEADRVQRTEVVSPDTGIVNKLNIHTLGGVIKPGETIAEITPTGGRVVIEGRIPDRDRSKIWPGLKAEVRLTAWDYSRYGTLEGKLDTISADSFADERTGQLYYKVVVGIDPTTIRADMRIVPGMTADIGILGSKRSVLSYLTRPISDIQKRALRD